MIRLSRPQAVGVLVTVVVIAASAAGIVVIGPPAEQRARRLDDRRVQDLMAIARAVDLYWTRHLRLPSSLDELRSEPGGNVSSGDPGTGMSYGYRPIDAPTYEVCARFQRDSLQGGAARDGFWSHGRGQQCFRREARRIG